MDLAGFVMLTGIVLACSVVAYLLVALSDRFGPQEPLLPRGWPLATKKESEYVRYVYAPQPDITIHELALIVGVVIYRGDPSKLDSWEQIKRHFRAHTSPSELKGSRFNFDDKVPALGQWQVREPITDEQLDAFADLLEKASNK